MSVNHNGDMSQWTLGNDFPACPHAQMVADSYRLCSTAGGIQRVRQSSDVPSIADCGRVIHSSLEIEVTSAATTVPANGNMGLVYRGEGSEWAKLHQRETTLRAWAKTNVLGVYHFGLANGPENLYCAIPVQIGVANVWTPVEVQISAAPGDWYTDNRVGYSLFWFLASGTAFHGVAGAWDEGAKCGDAAQVNFNAAVGNKINLTGFRACLADDPRPDEFEPQEETELKCMRYLEKSFRRNQRPCSNLGWGNGERTWKAIVTGAKVHSAHVAYTVPKRKDDVALTAFNPSGAGSQARALWAGDCTATDFDEKTAFGFRISATAPAGVAVNETIGAHWLADATLPMPGSPA